jgi:hypothetical protein
VIDRERRLAAGTGGGTSIIARAFLGEARLSLLSLIVAAAAISAAAPGASQAHAARPITVASYYFGNYHPGDPRNVKNKGEGWSEWELVKAARPRFPGHQQPKVPLWGFGLPGLHLNAVVWGQPILPGEKTPVDAAKLVRELGFDSVTSYVWIHHVPLPRQVTDYDFVRESTAGMSGRKAATWSRTWSTG